MFKLESFFIVLGIALLLTSYMLFKHFTYMPNVRPPRRLSVKPFDTFQFYLARDSNSGLLHLSPCPPNHPIYNQALRALYTIPQLTYDQVRYLRDLQYTFELASNSYMLSCFNDETIRLSAKFMDDMQLLASEMYAIARRLNLSMQVRFPRECDDPILVSNQMRSKPKQRVVVGSGADRRSSRSKSSSAHQKFYKFKTNEENLDRLINFKKPQKPRQ